MVRRAARGRPPAAGRPEAVTRLKQGLTAELLSLLEQSRANLGDVVHADLGDWMPARMQTFQREDLEIVWCGLSVRANDNSSTPARLRDVLFVALEEALKADAAETRYEWPGEEDVPWTEVVQYYLRAVD